MDWRPLEPAPERNIRVTKKLSITKGKPTDLLDTIFGDGSCWNSLNSTVWEDPFSLWRVGTLGSSLLTPEPLLRYHAGEDGSMTYELDLPGVRAEDVDASVSERVVRVHALRKSRAGHASLSKSWTLPNGLSTDPSEAKMADGVLTVVFPADASARPRKIEIK